MKLLFILFLLCSNLYATSIEQFLKMTDENKIDFLINKASPIEDDTAIASFTKKFPNLIMKISNVGAELANIWGDTILEGPYGLNGDPTTTINSIYTYQGKVYAFFAQVRAPALFVEGEECRFNEETGDYIDGCPEGEIYQNFYVDLRGVHIESDDYPEEDF